MGNGIESVLKADCMTGLAPLCIDDGSLSGLAQNASAFCLTLCH